MKSHLQSAHQNCQYPEMPRILGNTKSGQPYSNSHILGYKTPNGVIQKGEKSKTIRNNFYEENLIKFQQ